MAKIFHCVERHEISNPTERERRKIVLESWNRLYARGVVPCHLTEYKRHSGAIKDARKLPYLKDVLDLGRKQMVQGDILMWSNDDSILLPGIVEAVERQVRLFDAATSHRCDVLPNEVDLDLDASVYLACRRSHAGKDLFVSSYDWINRHWDELPDFLLGTSEFDYCLCCMIRREKGFPTEQRFMQDHHFQCELPMGYVLHQMHDAVWMKLGFDVAQRHNRILFQKWASQYGLPIKFRDKDLQPID